MTEGRARGRFWGVARLTALAATPALLAALVVSPDLAFDIL